MGRKVWAVAGEHRLRQLARVASGFKREEQVAAGDSEQDTGKRHMDARRKKVRWRWEGMVEGRQVGTHGLLGWYVTRRA